MHTTPLSVAVGSANPVKLAAARAVLAWAAPGATVESVTVPSGVPDQPFGDEETITGARNRARAAREALSTARRPRARTASSSGASPSRP